MNEFATFGDSLIASSELNFEYYIYFYQKKR